MAAFVRLLGEDCADEAGHRRPVGEDIHQVDAAACFLFRRSSGLLDQI